MFCFQCQETAKNQGCTIKGVCGKPEDTANLQDLLIHTLKGIAVYSEILAGLDYRDQAANLFTAKGLFATITNVNWDNRSLGAMISEALAHRERLAQKCQAMGQNLPAASLPDAATWQGGPETYAEKAKNVGVLATANEDVRSLRELLVIGLKGVAAYADHAAVLGHEDDAIYDFIMRGLASTTKDLSVDEMVALVMGAGEIAVKTMALLDQANTACLRPPGNFRSQFRCPRQSRYSYQRPRSQRHAGAAGTDRRYRRRCLHPRRNAAGQLLPGVQEIRSFCR